MEKILTIVVPTYNMEKYLDRCLSSLIIEDEKMEMLEVLVVNDGSKDRSSEIAHGYEARYPQTFRVIDKENGNYGSCVNRGMDEATGKYFRILDADDWFDTSSLVAYIDFLKCADVDAVLTDYCIHNKGFVTSVELPDYAKDGLIYNVETLIDSGFALEDFVSSSGSYVRMHQLTYSLDTLHASGLRMQHGISYTDTEFSYFPIKYVGRFSCKHINLYQYDASRDGQTMSVDSRVRSFGHMFNVAKRLLEDYKCVEDSVNKKLASIPLKSILYVFYQTALIYCTPTHQVKSYLSQIDSLLRDDEFLWQHTGGYVYRRIRVVKVWRNTGLLYRGPLFSIYDNVWSFLKNVIDSILAWLKQ